MELLTSCRRRGVDLLYSNMEMLLPLPRAQLTSSSHRAALPVSQSCRPDTPASSVAESSDCSDNISPVKMSDRMRKKKRRHSLAAQEESLSESEETFLSLKESQKDAVDVRKNTQSLESEKRKRTPLTPEVRGKRLPVSQCLTSMALFLDDMSYLDAFLSEEVGRRERAQRRFGAAIKDGMNDEPRAEMDQGFRAKRELASGMAAAVEALSFNKCRVSVTETWEKAQTVEGQLGKEVAAELRLPVSAHREKFSLCEVAPSHPQ